MTLREYLDFRSDQRLFRDVLTAVVSAAIKADPETYSAVFLEREPDDYVHRIEDSKTWGGAIGEQLAKR